MCNCELSFRCERCEETGEHICKRELVEALNEDEEFIERVWVTYQLWKYANDR